MLFIKPIYTYLIVVTVVFTFRASARATHPSLPMELPLRLQQHHKYNKINKNSHT